ncbi:MAG: esterase [Chloroflexota bacterium]|nr:esterase [Chloroflexota bacterium]
MSKLITTLGPRNASELGMILPHEHIFVDLRTWDQPGYAEAEPAEVIELMAPEIARAQAVGITTIVECSTVGVGRRADIDRVVSEATGLPIVVPTGVYREPWIPNWVHAASEEKLRDWMIEELQGEIQNSGVQAAWIKISAGDDGLTDCETKVLRAAAAAGMATNAVIGSHTIRGRVVREQLDIIEQAGYRPDRFIWIHTQAEPDFDLHLEMGRRGCWLEYDAIGSEHFGDQDCVRLVQQISDAGLADQLLLSHDRGWYDPALPGGGTPLPYTYLNIELFPQLLQAGISESELNQLTQLNPFQAFAR